MWSLWFLTALFIIYRNGSRAGSLRISAFAEDGASDDEALDAQDLQIKSLRTEIASLREDLLSIKEQEAENAKEKARLESLLKFAVAKLYPDQCEDKVQTEEFDESLLLEYVNRL